MEQTKDLCFWVKKSEEKKNIFLFLGQKVKKIKRSGAIKRSVCLKKKKKKKDLFVFGSKKAKKIKRSGAIE